MPEKSPVFVGIEILHAPGRLRRAFVYAALDTNRDLIAIGHGDSNEILAYLGGQQQAVAAINAPRQPNTGAANTRAVYQNELPLKERHTQINARLCEYLLQQQGLAIDQTPDNRKACPKWVQRGFDLYQRLNTFGYHPYPAKDQARQTLETHPEAIYWQFLDQQKALPNSLEGRLQRQLLLENAGLPVPDAMDFFLEITRHKLMHGELPDQHIHSFEELNALAAALIAWQAAHTPQALQLTGDPDEGQLVLPA